MAKQNMAKQIILPILVIIVGLAWLLNAMGMLPDVDWVWSVTVAAAGVLALAHGVNRITVTICPLLITASVLSVMRQTGHLAIDKEVPFLVIALGVFWLIATVMKVPMPKMPKPADSE